MTKPAKNYLKIFIVVSLISIFLCLCSCTINEKSIEDNTVKDIYGRNVEIPENVNRIATVGSAARICVYAGATDKLIGITEAEKPSSLRPYTIAYEEKFSTLPTTSNGNHLNSTTVDKEKLLSLKPDVIFSSRSASECDNLQNDIKIPVIGISFQDEIWSENVYNSIKICGKISGTLDHANETIDYLNACKEDLAKRCKSNESKIYRGAVNFKGSKDLTGTISNYCIYKAISVNNVADKEDYNSAYDTNLEQILAWNPDYIFMDCTNENKIIEQKTKNKEIFDMISAFKNDNAYYVAPFNNNGTNIEYGICEAYFTAKILYPEAFNDIDINNKFCEILLKLDGKDILQKLSDKGIYFGKSKL